MTTTTRRSRVPLLPDLDPEHYAFLDTLDKRQQRLGELADLDGAALLADVITKINAMLQTHRTQ
jgi:hypothetical protein